MNCSGTGTTANIRTLTRRAADEFTKDFVSLRQASGNVHVIRRDLSREPVPHLTAARFHAGLTPVDERNPEQAAEAALADELISELQTADILVIGMPMYNFNVPSTLKAWFDHVARAGATFRYTDNGAQGLLKAEKAYVFAARGGVYAGTDFDPQTPYIRQFLAFLGIDDVEFVYAEGLAMDEESRQKALESANERVAVLAA